MLTTLKRAWQNPLSAYYLALVLLLILVWAARDFLSLALFTIIFIYLANAAIMGFQKHLHLGHLWATLLVYLLFLIVLVAAFAQLIPPLVREIKTLPAAVDQLIQTYPQLETSAKKLVTDLTQNASVISSGKKLFTSGIGQLSRLSSGVETIVLAFFFSFIFNLTKTQLQRFVHAFTTSRFAKLFVPMGGLVMSFVRIFGTVIETQLMICSINTVLMVIGLWLLSMPNLLIL